LRRAHRGYAAGRHVTVSIRATTRAGLRPLRRAHRGYAAGRHVTVSIRATTRAGLRPLRRAHRGYAAGRHVSSSQSESWRVSGPGRVGPDLCECARHGQWPGPSSAGAAAAASQRHGRASGSAVTGHEWPHADGAPVGAVLEPFVLLSLDLCVGPRPRGSARGRGQTGSRSRALQDRFAGPPPYLDFIAGRPFPFRCTLIAALLHSMLLTPSARRRRFVVFFLQPFRGRLCRGTPEPHPWPSGPAGRPGFRSCWGRAGPAFSGGAPVAGRARAGPGPGPGRPGPDPGHLGVSTVDLGRLRGVPTLGCWAPPALFPPCWVTHCLRVCSHCDCRRAARAGLWTGAGGRDDASTPSGAARWEPHGAAPLGCAGAQAPLLPRAVC
jgi:hypothetical protein